MRKVKKERPGRSAIACNNCRRRKTRCDSETPVCGACARSGKTCVYTPLPRQTRKEPRLLTLERKFDHLEAFIEKEFPNFKKSSSPPVEDTKLEVSDDDERGTESPPQTIEQTPAADREKMDSETYPTFNDRLARIKACVGGCSGDYTIYMSNAFFSILSSSDIEALSVKLQDPYFGTKLENASYEVWQLTNSTLSAIVPSVAGFSPDSFFVNRSLEILLAADTKVLFMLVTKADLDPRKWSDARDPMQEGIRAAVVIIGGVAMYLNSDFEVFSEEFVGNQVRSAYFQAIRSLNAIHFAKPSFFHVRIWIVLFWVLRVFASIPSLLSFLEPIINMAKAIGLNNAILDTNLRKDEAEWRQAVWIILVDFQYSLCASTYLKPYVRQHLYPQTSQSLMNLPMMDFLGYTIPLNDIFDEAREKLFALNLRYRDPQEVYEDILRLDREVEEWHERVPQNFWKSDVVYNSSFLEFLNSYRAGDIQNMYFHTIIAIHSIPAFTPRFLPEEIPNSLEKVLKAARSLFRFGVVMNENKSLLRDFANVNITTALFVFLYKQVCYPNHESNRADLLHLQERLSMFTYQNWPIRRNLSPEAKIWELILDLIAKLYYSNNGSAGTTFAEHDMSGNFFSEEPIKYDNGQCSIS